MTITHQIKTNGNPLTQAGSIASQISGLIAQAQGLVSAGVGLPGLQNIGSQIATLGPSLQDAGAPPEIAGAIVVIGQQMSSASMGSMSGFLTSLNTQIAGLTGVLNQAGSSQVLHKHVLDAIQGIIHSAFQGQHTVQLGSAGIDLTSVAKVAHTAPVLPHNGRTTVSDALQVTKGITAQAFGMLSDRHLKTKVRKHGPVLEKVLRLRLKTFDVKAVNWETGEIVGDIEPRSSLGFIAQQFAKVFPQLVRRSGKYLAIEEEKVGPILAAALQEFVAETRSRIAELEAEIEELRKR